jgi:hypothetical protein
MKTLYQSAIVKRISLLIFLSLLTIAFISSNTAAKANSPATGLAATVKNLKLGFGNYIIGSILTSDQVVAAQSNLQEKAYEGTYKFKDNDTFVVAEKSSNMVLAVYQNQENVDREQMKKIIAILMTNFGEPTTMAHDKLVYWAYKKEGKIPEEMYNDSKKTGKLDVVATVKMNSTMEIFGDISPEENADSQEAAVTESVAGTVYTLISSQPLLESFLQQQE